MTDYVLAEKSRMTRLVAAAEKAGALKAAPADDLISSEVREQKVQAITNLLHEAVELLFTTPPQFNEKFRRKYRDHANLAEQCMQIDISRIKTVDEIRDSIRVAITHIDELIRMEEQILFAVAA